MPDIQLCNDFGLLLLDNYGILAKQTERKKFSDRIHKGIGEYH